MTDVAPQELTSVFGVDLCPPSSGRQAPPTHLDDIRAAAKETDDDTFTETRAKLRAQYIEPWEDRSEEDKEYFESVLYVLAGEWMVRLWGGEADKVAADYVDDLTIEELDEIEEEFYDEFDEGKKRHFPSELSAVREYYSEMLDVIDKSRDDLSISREVNNTAQKQQDADTTNPKGGCSGSRAAREERELVVTDNPIWSEDAEPTPVVRMEPVAVVQQPAQIPRDFGHRVSCRRNGCDGYMLKNKQWFCDELITGIRKPKNEPEKWSSVEQMDIWYGGGQLGYAAWGNEVAIVIKATEDGLSESAKATATTFGSVTGWVGVGLGLIDLGFCAARWRKTNKRLRHLAELLGKHFGEDADEEKVKQKILKYAVKKKHRKKARTGVAAYFATVGVIGGTMGGLAFIASNPIGWAVAIGFGLAAVLGGLGFITWKVYKKRRKARLAKKERDRLYSCYRNGRLAERDTASGIVQAIDRNRGTLTDDPYGYEVAGNDSTDDKVVKKLLFKHAHQRRKTERQAMASAIVGYFISEIEESVRNPVDTELDPLTNCGFGEAILAALNKNPGKMYGKYIDAMDEDTTNQDTTATKKLAGKWIESVMGKLKSW